MATRSPNFRKGVRALPDSSCSSVRFSARQLLPRLRGLGIEARVALPFRWRKPERLDLRNHRKIVVIDGRISYTGSQNMVSPDFKPGLTYSELVARIEGPTALQLQLVFGADWFVETGHYIGAAAFPSPQKNSERHDWSARLTRHLPTACGQAP